MRILVTGGAGYIGSHVVKALHEAGHGAVVLDDLREGHRASLARFPGVEVIEGDISDDQRVDDAFGKGEIDGVIHMAASCLVGESMREPARYFENNVVRTLRLIDRLALRGVTRFVFSSTAAVYGDPSPGSIEPIDEDAPCRPTNVYGETKLAVERALQWYGRCTPLRSVSLRYFNAAGADPSGQMGEDHDPETHLIPLACRALLGTDPPLTILGRDYDTPDGTCLRDYVHVDDLAGAHLLALEALAAGEIRGLAIYNLGAGRAASVLEVIGELERVAGRRVPVADGPRREGDPPVLLASSDRIRRDLGWSPTRSDLSTILNSAWRWHEGHPHGYDEAASP